MLAGASYNEIALVVFLLVIVVIAPKIGRIGDALGGLFGGGRSRGDAPADDDPRG